MDPANQGLEGRLEPLLYCVWRQNAALLKIKKTIYTKFFTDSEFRSVTIQLRNLNDKVSLPRDIFGRSASMCLVGIHISYIPNSRAAPPPASYPCLYMQPLPLWRPTGCRASNFMPRKLQTPMFSVSGVPNYLGPLESGPKLLSFGHRIPFILPEAKLRKTSFFANRLLCLPLFYKKIR